MITKPYPLMDGVLVCCSTVVGKANMMMNKILESLFMEHKENIDKFINNCFFTFENEMLEKMLIYIFKQIDINKNEIEKSYEIEKYCRMYILEMISKKQISIMNIKNKSLISLYGKPITIFSEYKTLLVLSLLEDKEQFNYLIKKYYYFEDIPSNIKYDNHILGLFSGKGSASVYFTANHIKKQNVCEMDLYGNLYLLPLHFYSQINNGLNFLIPDAVVCKNKLLVSTLNSHELSMTYTKKLIIPFSIFMFIMFIAVMGISIYYSFF